MVYLKLASSVQRCSDYVLFSLFFEQIDTDHSNDMIYSMISSKKYPNRLYSVVVSTLVFETHGYSKYYREPGFEPQYVSNRPCNHLVDEDHHLTFLQDLNIHQK
jgi:hypothetical protein